MGAFGDRQLQNVQRFQLPLGKPIGEPTLLKNVTDFCVLKAKHYPLIPGGGHGFFLTRENVGQVLHLTRMLGD